MPSFTPPHFTYNESGVEILNGYTVSKTEAKAGVTLTSKWAGVNTGPTQVEGWVNGKHVTNATPSADLAASLGICVNENETLHTQINGSRESFAAGVLTQRDAYMSHVSTNATATQVYGADEVKAVDAGSTATLTSGQVIPVGSYDFVAS